MSFLDDLLKRTRNTVGGAYQAYSQGKSPAQHFLPKVADSLDSFRPVTSPLPDTPMDRFTRPVQNISVSTAQRFLRDLPEMGTSALRASPAGQAYEYAKPLFQKQTNLEKIQEYQKSLRKQQLSDLFNSAKLVGNMPQFIPANAAGGALNVGMNAIMNKINGRSAFEDYDKTFAEGYAQSAPFNAVAPVASAAIKALPSVPILKGMKSLVGDAEGELRLAKVAYGAPKALARRTAGSAIRGGTEGLLLGSIGPNQEGKTRLDNIAEQTIFGTILGGATQFAGDIPALVRLKVLGNVADKIKALAPEKTAQEAENEASRFIRDELGRFAGGKQSVQQRTRDKLGMSPDEPVYYGDLRESLGLPKNGNYQEGAIDLEAKIENPFKKSVSQDKPLDEILRPKEIPLLPQGRMEVDTAAEARKAMKKGIFPEVRPNVLPAGKKPIITPSTSGAVNAEASPKTIENIRQKVAKEEFSAWRDQYRSKTVSPAQQKNQGVKNITESIKTNTKSVASQAPEELKDISGWKTNMRDVYRNFKEVYGKRFDEVKRSVLDPFDKSKGDYVAKNESWAGKLKKDIVDDLGIKKNSKESAAVQLWGEGKMPEETLYQRFGPEGAEKIKKADVWFRQAYNELVDTINATRKQIYPNSPEKWISKRQDYYRHFREMQEGVGALFNIFDTPSNISSSLAGVSEGMKPKAKFLSLAQQRKGEKTDIDAVGGFLDYIKQASYATHIDKHTERFRSLADELAQGTTESKNINNFIEYLQDYANDLSGKTNPADRFIQKIIPGGRTAFRAINWVNNRVKSNAVIGNVSSALSQIMNVPQGIAEAGLPNSMKGIGRTLAGIFTENPAIKRSNFVRERFSDPFSKFDEGIIADTGKFAKWMTGALDKVGTQVIWNSQYEKALSQGIQDATKYADDVTRSLVAGRGIGEVPLLQKARVMQLVAPFQLEVQNLWWVLKDMVDEKSAGKIVTFFIANHLMNKGIESIRGSDVTFDPIQSLMDGYKSFSEEDDKAKGAMKFAGRQAGEVLGNVPFGQTAAALYPEYGVSVGDTKLPTRRDFFGKGNPVRQGSGILAAEGLKDPLYKLIPPYGGAQIKKSIEGAKTLLKGFAGKDDAIQYPVERTKSNVAKGILFGKSALAETRDYYDNDQRPLSEKQSEFFLQSKDKKGDYKTLITKREEDAEVTKAKESLKAEDGAKKVGNKYLYLDDAGEVKTIDIGKVSSLPDATPFDKAKKKEEAFKLIDEAVNLPEDMKSEVLTSLGVKDEDATYYNIATQTQKVRYAYLSDQLSKVKDPAAGIIPYLKTINDKGVATGLLDTLYEDGVIDKSQKILLSKLKYDEETGKFRWDRDYLASLGSSGKAQAKKYMDYYSDLFKGVADLSKPTQRVVRGSNISRLDQILGSGSENSGGLKSIEDILRRSTRIANSGK